MKNTHHKETIPMIPIIPNIIHQMWIQGYNDMPLKHKTCCNSWPKKNADYV